MKVRAILFVLTITTQDSSSAPHAEPCPIIARLPADSRDTEPPDYRAWFELRQCSGESVIVSAYEPHKPLPSLVFDTDYPYPVQMMHATNLLAFESVGGSTNQVFVFGFQGGKPRVLLKRSTAGGVKISSSDSYLVLRVPPKTYPGMADEERVYRFRVE